jgi:hypothetical protein
MGYQECSDVVKQDLVAQVSRYVGQNRGCVTKAE